MRALLLACWLVLCGATLAAPPVEYLGPGLQDGDGVVWAIDRHSPTRLHAFRDGAWVAYVPLEPEFPKTATPQWLTALPSGEVACFWRREKESDDFLITRHRGSTSRPLVRTRLAVPESSHRKPVFTGDSKGRLWGNIGPKLYRIDPDSTTTLIHTLHTGETFLASKGGSRSAQKEHNPLHGVEDAAGRMWFWSEGYSNSLSLTGLLRVEGEAASLITFPELEVPHRWLSLHPREDGTLFLRSFNHGVFILDPVAQKLTPLPGPKAGEPLLKVSQILHAGGGWYFIANRDADTAADESTLWELRNGKWREHLAPKGHGFPRHTQGDVRLLPVPNGLLCIFDNENPWFLGKGGGPPARLGWENGFPLHHPRHFFRLKDGTFLAWDSNSGTLHGPLRLPPRPAPAPGTSVLEQVSHRAGQWWVLHRDSRHLYHGDPASPKKVALPKEVPNTDSLTLAPEVNGRLWLLPRKAEQPVFILTPASGKWEQHATLKEAVQAYLGRPPHFEPLEELRCIPAFTTDGQRAVFQEAYKTIHYFDGSQWQQWTKKETGTYYTGYPFFDADDRLCTIVLAHLWVYHPKEGRWVCEAPKREGSFPRERSNRGVPREYGKRPHPTGYAWDEEGTFWYVQDRELYRLRPGHEPVAVFEKGVNHPFREFPQFFQISRDAFGNRIFGRENLVILSPKATPRASATAFLQEKRNNTVHLQNRAAIEMQWRIDGGPWQAYSRRGIPIPPGESVLEAIGFNAGLNVEHPPARFGLTYTAKVPPEALVSVPRPPVEALIHQLRHPDFAMRRRAIAHLAKQPEAALPALRAARATAEGDARWWIDAALQELHP